MDRGVEAAGEAAEGLASAMSLITASLCRHAGLTDVVRDDLQRALNLMLRRDRPTGRANAVAQQTLQEVIGLLAQNPPPGGGSAMR